MKHVPTVIIVLLVSILVFAKNVTVMDTRLNVINTLEPASDVLVLVLEKLAKNVELETPLDVVFLIDGSDSIIEEDFSKVKEWIIQMISELGVEKLENDLLLTIAQFSSSVETELMEKTNNKDKLTDQIRNIKQMAMGTNLYSGLSHVSKDILPK